MAAPAGLTRAMVWLSLWVSTPMTWSTLSASMGRCLLRGVAVSVPALARETAWQDCDGSRRTADRLLIRPTSRSARPAPAPRQTVQCQGSPSGRQLRWESCRGTSADPDSDPSRPPPQSHSRVGLHLQALRLRSSAPSVMGRGHACQCHRGPSRKRYEQHISLRAWPVSKAAWRHHAIWTPRERLPTRRVTAAALARLRVGQHALHERRLALGVALAVAGELPRQPPLQLGVLRGQRRTGAEPVAEPELLGPPRQDGQSTRQRSTMPAPGQRMHLLAKAGGVRPDRFRYPVAQVPTTIESPVPYVEVLAQTKSQVTYNVGRCRSPYSTPDRRLPARLVRLGYSAPLPGFGNARRSTSASWASDTPAGAPVRGSAPDWVFGNAITSRMESTPASSITTRSRPKAMPPCGGAPKDRPRSRKPNFSSASAASMPSTSKTRRCTSALCTRMLPPPSSTPLSTRS